MDLMEWLLLAAIVDGPVMALLYLLWRRLRNETK